MAWKQGALGVGDDIVEAAGMGGGLQAETGNHGQPRVGSGMIGRPGSGERVGRKAGGAVRRHVLTYWDMCLRLSKPNQNTV